MKSVEPFYIEVGRRIQNHRINKHLSQEALGRMLDRSVTRASIANIEAGKQRILAHTLVQIADALGVELAEIIPLSKQEDEIKPPSFIPAEKIEAELIEKLQLSKEEAKKLTAKMKKPAQESKR